MMKKIMLLCLICVISMFTLLGCGRKCKACLDRPADPKCAAKMCDDCCSYYVGLNGCLSEHY